MYNSISTGEPCSSAQLLAEMMVLRRAAKQKIKLVGHFWNTDPWRKYYGQEIIAANAVLKVYDIQAVLRALKRRECNWQYTLRVKGMSDIFQEEQTKLEDENKRLETAAERQFSTATTTEIISHGKASLRSKLD